MQDIYCDSAACLEGNVINAFDTCLNRLDQLAIKFNQGAINAAELENHTFVALEAYFDDERPEDDVDFLIAFAREPFELLVEDPLDGDREATNRFDRFVRRCLHYPVALANLSNLLDQACSVDDDDSLLVDLCASGYSDHLRIFLFSDLDLEVIQAARNTSSVAALVAAVDPRRANLAQLGGPSSHQKRARHLAFQSLGELAARTDGIGQQALDALIDLCRYWETAALASVHLPAYRLSREQRGLLADSAEALDDLLNENALLVPDFEANRAPASIRSVLWLANDASYLAN